MCHVMLGVEALERMDLHLESLPARGYPARVDPLVLSIGPPVLGVIHLVAATFELFLDFVVALGIALRLEAECKADRVSYLTKSLGYGHARLGCKLLGDLLFGAVVALAPVLEAAQPAPRPAPPPTSAPGR